MELFKEINCAYCGQKAGLLTRTKLCDGNYLCSQCTSIIPSFMRDSFYQKYTLENYNEFKEYLKYSDRYLRPKFHETHSFYAIHLDTENFLFYIGYEIKPGTVFLSIQNISRFNIIFKAENYKDGLLGTKVNGKIMFELGMNNPCFYHEEILDHSAKTKAKKTFFGNNIEYENPEGMDDFLYYFNHARELSTEDSDYEYSYESSHGSNNNDTSELQQAIALFMFDDLEGITLDGLRAQRNKLIKAFHPDVATTDDTKYAQKINAAYELIKKAIQ